MMRFLAGLAAVFILLSAHSVRASEPDFEDLVATMIDDHVIPAYRALTGSAAYQASIMTALCAYPNHNTLAVAETGFADLVDAFSKVELYRFGPARVENRFERLFFWPDRRGRGLRQVQGLLSEQDKTVLSPDALSGKSVAVQGISAFDYVLAGKGADSLATDAGAHRCLYGVAIARRIEAVSAALLSDWERIGGYGDLMKTPGTDNPIYRNRQEVVQEFLRAIGEQLQITTDFKLGRVLGDAQEKAKPKRAPFWRSRNWLRSVDGNIQAIQALFSEGRFMNAMPVRQSGLIAELLFELAQARRAVMDVDRAQLTTEETVAAPDQYETLRYATIPLGAAGVIVRSRLPEALGLSLGFNSLDGD